MKKKIAVLQGDGVGPEIVNASINVLKAVGSKFDHEFTFSYGLVGAAAIDKTGEPFPEATEKLCKSSDAILFGAIGDPKYDHNPFAKIRPEQGLLQMRKTLGLYANVRPIKTFEALTHQSPLKEGIVKDVNFVIIRELIGGIYFGKQGREEGGKAAYDICMYTKAQIQRIAKFAFNTALQRRKLLTLVDKANVLETSRLWRETIQKMSHDFPTITVEYIFVDNAAMQIIKNPRSFDVILTENMFGDILSDEASVIIGSIGMLPSASIGEKISVYEPIHGSYSKAAGQNIANPIGTILSTAMMLEFSFGMKEEAKIIRDVINSLLLEGVGTRDIVPENPIFTSQMGDRIANIISSQ